MADTYLSIVDDNDTVVGRELRSVIHKTGLRHREVHVWLITTNGQLVLQKRSPTKDTYPNMLDASVGGHVEEGQGYLQAALAEVQEEAGLDVRESDLIELAMVDAEQIDATQGINNTVFRMIYALRTACSVEDLQIEDADGSGFVVHSLDEIEQNDALREMMIPGLFADSYAAVWPELKRLIG